MTGLDCWNGDGDDRKIGYVFRVNWFGVVLPVVFSLVMKIVPGWAFY